MTAAAALDDGEFWLPACCLSEENKVTGAWRSEKDARVSSLMEKEFPYEFGMFRPEDDEFFAGLTQRLTLSESRKLPPYKPSESFKVSAGSPQSTLRGIGSWSGRSSNGSNHNSPPPPPTPFESRDDNLGLIYAAAGQVARLERKAEDPLQAALSGQLRAVAQPNHSLQMSPHQNLNANQQMKQNYLTALIWEHQLQNISRFELSNQLAWPPSQQSLFPVKPNYQAVQLQRKESAGTGVFIPRRYDAATTSVPPRKRAVAPCALVPARVVQALSTSIEATSACSRTHCDPIHSAASVSQQSYDALVAMRRGLLDQQQRSTARNEDIVSRRACLPQEWSY